MVKRSTWLTLGFLAMSAPLILPIATASAQMVVPRAKPKVALTGEALVKQECGACHSLNAGEVRVGPSLSAMAGKKAASVPGYSYSAALKKKRLVWNAATLDLWLKDSQALVPDTSMYYEQSDVAKRKEIVNFLISNK